MTKEITNVNSNSSAETGADSNNLVEAYSVSQNGTKPNVGRLWLSPLAWLLHHSNREGKDINFYAIKNKLLKKYGKHICYDVQFIEGKQCFSCDGTGIYYESEEDSEIEYCYKCASTGWYKKNTWNILEKVQFGKFTFHQPYQRAFVKPDISIPFITGYIEHKKSKYGWLAKSILFLIYDKKYLKRYYQNVMGWRCSWYLPKNWLFTILHFVKYKQKAYPIQDLRTKFMRYCEKSKHKKDYYSDLPF
jgi:hypothetical protein